MSNNNMAYTFVACVRLIFANIAAVGSQFFFSPQMKAQSAIVHINNNQKNCVNFRWTKKKTREIETMDVIIGLNKRSSNLNPLLCSDTRSFCNSATFPRILAKFRPPTNQKITFYNLRIYVVRLQLCVESCFGLSFSTKPKSDKSISKEQENHRCLECFLFCEILFHYSRYPFDRWTDSNNNAITNVQWLRTCSRWWRWLKRKRETNDIDTNVIRRYWVFKIKINSNFQANRVKDCERFILAVWRTISKKLCPKKSPFNCLC